MKRQAKVEDLGLLVLRLLLLALLALAFSRPVIRAHGGWLGAGRSVASVVVIDATASMSWRGDAASRIDAAKHLAREWIGGLAPSDAIALWVLTDRLEKPVPVPITDRGFVFEQLDAIKASDGSSSLAPVFNAAYEWASSRGIGRKEMVVITDHQAAAWGWPAKEYFLRSWDRSGVNLVVMTPDSARASNVGVEAVAWDDRAVREGALLTGMAKIVNYGDSAVSDLLECRIAGQMSFRKPVDIPAGGSVDVPLSVAVPAMNRPVLTGELALAGDALACDDRWFFAVPVRYPLNALVVDREGGVGGGMKSSFFLTKAIAAGGVGRALAIDSDKWIKHSTDGIESLWFTGAAVIDEAAWAKALHFAEAGGTVVVTGASQPEPLPKDWPVSAGKETRLPTGRMATRLLAPGHPLFDGVWSESTPFPPLPQTTARSCVPSADGKLLATLAGGFPLLVEVPHGKGRLFWLNASLDRSWGDLPLSPAYVALVQQMARARELAQQTSAASWVGQAWPDLAKFQQGTTWSAADGGEPATRASRGGLFDAVSPAGEILLSCAVNVRRAESDLRPVNAPNLQAMLPGKMVAGEQGIREWREEMHREVPLWPWLLALAAAVYLAEGWMSARAAKRRELNADGDIPKWMARRAGS